MPGTEDAFFQVSGDTLPADAHAIRYEAREYISRPFEVDIEFSTEDSGFDVLTCLRKNIVLTLVNETGATRYFHGIVEQAEFVDYDGTRFYFQLSLRPMLSALAHREDCRIYQETNIIDVVKKVFTAAGIPADKVEWALYQDYESREFIVQYRETELNFVHRLFEDDGIFYFFRHTPDGHKMVVSDDADVFAKNDDAPEVHFAMSQGLLSSGEPIEEFTRTKALRNTKVELRDYDFEKPATPPKAEQTGEDRLPLPYYEFPGCFTKGPVGKRRALARLRELRRDADTCHGRSTSIGMRVGVPFDMEGASHEFLNGEFVTTELRTWGEQRFESTKNFVCKNEFSGIPKGSPFAAPRSAYRPRIHGIQTAIVTGAANDDQSIHCDKYGRIKVRFYWDRVGQQDDKSSCWLRTQQLITGGSVILPRVGWEVAVGFFNGDPDQPYCVGRSYNGELMVPYALPGANASGALKSHSSPGGAGNNEIKMSDTGGSQGFGVHAQKDLNTTINHDKNESVAVDETHDVKVNMQSTVGSNETLIVGSNQTIDVGANLSCKVSGSQTVTVGAVEQFNTTHNYVENCGGSRTYTVGANQTTICNGLAVEAKAGITRNVGAAQLVGSVAAITENVGGMLSETIGAVKLIVCKGVVSEAVGGIKSQTCTAAELHLVSGNFQTQAKMVTHLIGGLHYEKVAADYSIKAPMVTLLGATGAFKGGGSELKLGGGPVLLKGSKIAVKGAMMIKMGASLKLGA